MADTLTLLHLSNVALRTRHHCKGLNSIDTRPLAAPTSDPPPSHTTKHHETTLGFSLTPSRSPCRIPTILTTLICL